MVVTVVVVVLLLLLRCTMLMSAIALQEMCKMVPRRAAFTDSRQSDSKAIPVEE